MPSRTCGGDLGLCRSRRVLCPPISCTGFGGASATRTRYETTYAAACNGARENRFSPGYIRGWSFASPEARPRRKRTVGKQRHGTVPSLFQVILGKTAAGGEARLRLLDSISETDDMTQKTIVVRALTKGTQTEDFIGIGTPGTQGSRPSTEPWRPPPRRRPAITLKVASGAWPKLPQNATNLRLLR